MKIAVYGAGAFGTALALALSQNETPITLVARDAGLAAQMQNTRETGPKLPNHTLKPSITVTSSEWRPENHAILLAVPMASLASAADQFQGFTGPLIACCKGIRPETGLGPVGVLNAAAPKAQNSLLTGPSFAIDIAKGLPTALTLATTDEAQGTTLQTLLSRPTLRLYRTTDVTGAELGGALKNVVALAAGMTIGAGLGDSARASIIARGFAEMQRYASAIGALPETLAGLSGLGDLVLTCTSEKSRNYTAGLAIGQGASTGPGTIEGLATAQAVAQNARKLNLDLPLFTAVDAVVSGRLDITGAMTTLMARPVGKE